MLCGFPFKSENVNHCSLEKRFTVQRSPKIVRKLTCKIVWEIRMRACNQARLDHELQSLLNLK